MPQQLYMMYRFFSSKSQHLDMLLYKRIVPSLVLIHQFFVRNDYHQMLTDTKNHRDNCEMSKGYLMEE